MSSSELNTLRRGEGDSSTSWEVFSELLDDAGHPRLKWARNYFSRLKQEDVPVLSEAFKYWRDYDEFLLLHGEHRRTGEELHVAVKCSKRGNDVFSDRLDRKLGCLQELEGIDLFKLEDFEEKGTMSANLLWVTLTFNSGLCSLNEAWNKIGEMWNLWITNMRNEYGQIFVLKFLEAFPDPEGKAYGYPHIHAILLFKDHKFKAFPNWEKNKRTQEFGWVYRVQERDEIKAQGKWHSNSDIKAINSGRALGGYLRKHCKNTHGGDAPAALVTQSLLWLKKKKTFSMSSGFRRELHALITDMRNSKTSCGQKMFEKTCWVKKLKDGKICDVQVTLKEGVIDDWIWSCHGVKSSFDVGAEKGVWIVSLAAAKFHSLVGGD